MRAQKGKVRPGEGARVQDCGNGRVGSTNFRLTCGIADWCVTFSRHSMVRLTKRWHYQSRMSLRYSLKVLNILLFPQQVRHSHHFPYCQAACSVRYTCIRFARPCRQRDTTEARHYTSTRQLVMIPLCQVFTKSHGHCWLSYTKPARATPPTILLLNLPNFDF